MKNKETYQYIAGLKGNQYRSLKKHLIDKGTVYSDLIKDMRYKQELMDRVGEGGNFGTFVKKAIKTFNPFDETERKKVKKNIQENKKYFNRTMADEIDPHTRQLSRLVSETYKPEDKRKDVGDFVLDKNHSTDHYSIYTKNNESGPTHYFVYRGTKNAKDIVPDLKVLTGTVNFDEERKEFNKLRKEVGGEDWKIVGHSLGGTKAMWLGQRENVDVHAFNPGYSYLFEEKLNTSHPKLNLYLVNTDPISHGLQFEKLNENTKIYEGDLKDPLGSHGIKFFN